jgi:hypothetical protein
MPFVLQMLRHQVLNKLLQQQHSTSGNVNSVKVLILVPTRELVEQTAHVLQQLTRFCAGCITVTPLSSDQPLSAQRAALVSCPHVRRCFESFSHAHMLRRNNRALRDACAGRRFDSFSISAAH